MKEKNKNTAIGIDSMNDVTTGGPCTPLGKCEIYYKLRNSFNSLAKDYKINERWREHFETLLDELPSYKEERLIVKLKDRIKSLRDEEDLVKNGTIIGHPAGQSPTKTLRKEFESLLNIIDL